MKPNNIKPPKTEACGPRWTREAVDRFARTRVSKNFILRDFLYCASAVANGFPNLPEHPEQVIACAKALCDRVLEPILDRFGRFAITYGYQSRQSLEFDLMSARQTFTRTSSNPHNWDRQTWGEAPYARVDVLPFCVEDGSCTKDEFGKWLMMNLDIDLLMDWTRSNVYCITISPRPRRVWIRWGRPSKGEPQQTVLMGAHYWQTEFPKLAESERPKFHPSLTQGALTWRAPLLSAAPQKVDMWMQGYLNETSEAPSLESSERSVE